MFSRASKVWFGLIFLFVGMSSFAWGDPVEVPQATPIALQYASWGRSIWLWGTLYKLSVPLGFYFFGFSTRLKSFCDSRWGLSAGKSLLCFLAVFLIYQIVASLPLRFLSGFVRPHVFGLSQESFLAWFLDALKRGGLEFVFCFVLWGVPFGLMRHWPQKWWIFNGILAFPGLVFMMYVQPLFIAPLFHEFGPMRNAALEQRILELAGKVGVGENQVFEVKRRHQTKTVNAYVTGLLGARRIVLWDTLVDRLEADGVLFVMAHELGHHSLGHLKIGLALSVLGSFVLFFLVDRSARIVLSSGTFFGRQQFLGDPHSIPLFVFLTLALTFAGSPLALFVSRSLEKEADRFALELTHENQAGGKAFVTLMQSNLADPWPSQWEVLFRYSHPPLGMRVTFCNEYAPWKNGEEEHYAAYWRKASPDETN